MGYASPSRLTRFPRGPDGNSVLQLFHAVMQCLLACFFLSSVCVNCPFGRLLSLATQVSDLAANQAQAEKSLAAKYNSR